MTKRAAPRLQRRSSSDAAAMESATIRCSYPETQKILNARRNKHPSEDEISDAGYAASWAASKQAEAAAAAGAAAAAAASALASRAAAFASVRGARRGR